MSPASTEHAYFEMRLQACLLISVSGAGRHPGFPHTAGDNHATSLIPHARRQARTDNKAYRVTVPDLLVRVVAGITGGCTIPAGNSGLLGPLLLRRSFRGLPAEGLNDFLIHLTVVCILYSRHHSTGGALNLTGSCFVPVAFQMQRSRAH